MNAREMAAQLNGRFYRNELRGNVAALAKESGLVIVYGASDDLMEFAGAIDDEIGAYDGTIACVTKAGLLKSECQDGGEDCPYYKRDREKATRIYALWGETPCPWTFKTEIPHETFDIFDEGELFCRGIVFALADVP